MPYHEVSVEDGVPVSGRDAAMWWGDRTGECDPYEVLIPLQGWARREVTFTCCTEKMNRILCLQVTEQFCEQNWVEQKEFKLGFWRVSLKLEWNFPSGGSRAVVALTVLRWIAQCERIKCCKDKSQSLCT